MELRHSTPALKPQKALDPSQDQDHHTNPSDQSASKFNKLAVMIIPSLDEKTLSGQVLRNQLDFVIDSEGQKMAIMKTANRVYPSYLKKQKQAEQRIQFERNMIHTYSKDNQFMIKLIRKEEIMRSTAYSGTCNLEINKVDIKSDLEPVAHASLDDSNEPSIAESWSFITEYTYLEDASRFFLEVGEIDLSLKLGKERVSPELRYSYMEQILTCIDIMSRQRIAHRDIKPSNFVVFKNQQIKVIDLEQACIMDHLGYSLHDSVSNAGGTPNFLSPEQLFTILNAHVHVLCHKTDVWSAGITLILVMLPKQVLRQCIQKHVTDTRIAALAKQASTDTDRVSESFIFQEYRPFLKDLFDQLKQYNISEPFIILLRGMLTLDIQNRWSAQRVLSFFHQYIYNNNKILCFRQKRPATS